MIFKNTLRKEITNILSSISKDDILNKSRIISNKLFLTKEWKESKSIFIYLTFRQEIETMDIINMAIRENKKVMVPRISNKDMSFYRIDNLESKLESNKMGIKEPPLGLIEEFPSPNSLIIVPGLGFSITGDRLGRGGGYYDRYLNKNKNGILIALAFDCQIVENIPMDGWDIRVSKVISESFGEINEHN